MRARLFSLAIAPRRPQKPVARAFSRRRRVGRRCREERFGKRDAWPRLTEFGSCTRVATESSRSVATVRDIIRKFDERISLSPLNLSRSHRGLRLEHGGDTTIDQSH